MNVETLSSETVFTGRVFGVRRDRVVLPNGRQHTFDIVTHAGAVTIVPLDEQGRVWFIRQYRHPAGEVMLELPAGVIENGENPAASALRELREEIGQTAAELSLLGTFFLAPGYSTELMHVYLARQLSPAPLPGDADEQIEVAPTPLDEVDGLVWRGAVRDAKSLAALLLLRLALNANL
jgi:ADP-ribose pyrophosphatase